MADFCEEHNLRYFLGYGTLLGAVRHKGFIPWDDDVDIIMPKDDYLKLIDIFNKEKKEDHLFLVDPMSDLARHTFVKIIDQRTVKIEGSIEYLHGNLGVDIDVFPVDGVPEDEEEYRKWYKKLYMLYRMCVWDVIDWKTTTSKKLKLALPFIKPFLNRKKLLAKAEKLHSLYPYNNSVMVDEVSSIFNLAKHKLYKVDFDEYEYSDFEDRKFRIPKAYDKILTSTYGDYMTPPPKENRTTHHTNKCYWK